MPNFLKMLFSIQGIKGYTIVRILGIKITLKKKQKTQSKNISNIDKELLKIESYKLYKQRCNQSYLDEDSSK